MKKWVFILFILFFSIGTISCSVNKRIDHPPGQEDPAATPKAKEVEAILYYANQEYVKTGNENLERLIPRLIPVKKTISIQGNSLPLSILNALKEPPAEKNMFTQIFPELTFLGVEVKDHIAYVDISSQNLNGSSLQEYFIINQIVYSLTELENIDKVQFLVDGKKSESLMGHFEISEPLGRKESE